MSITLTLSKSVTVTGSSALSGSATETGSNLATIDTAFPAGSVNTTSSAAFAVADLKAFILVASQPMTLSTNGTNAVKRITITGSPTGGSLTTTVNGQTTAAIAYNATAAAVQSALEALSNVAVGDVTCSGGPLPGTPVDCAFSANLGLQAVTMSTTDSLTGGSSPASAVTTPTPGVAPDDSFTLPAGIPFVWSLSEGYFANPFTADVVKFNVTCATSSRLQGRILT